MVSVRLIMLSVVAVRSLRRGSVGLPLRSLRRCAASSDGGERRIDSAKNDLVKLCKSLHRRKGRESTGLVLLEGTRLVGDALAAGSGARHVLVSDGVEEGVGCLPAAAARAVPDGSLVRAPAKVVAACCDTSSPQGVVAVVEKPAARAPSSARLVLALDGVSDPGNVGALIRTAAAAGCDAVVVVGAQCADPWSPKALRAAMGATFRVPVVDHRADGWGGADARLRGDWNLSLYAADLAAGAEAYDDVAWARPGACVVVGAEVGLSRDLATLLDDGASDPTLARVFIPMGSDVESLNAAVAGSLLLFEARKAVGARP